MEQSTTANNQGATRGFEVTFSTPNGNNHGLILDERRYVSFALDSLKELDDIEDDEQGKQLEDDILNLGNFDELYSLFCIRPSLAKTMEKRILKAFFKPYDPCKLEDRACKLVEFYRRANSAIEFSEESEYLSVNEAISMVIANNWENKYSNLLIELESLRSESDRALISQVLDFFYSSSDINNILIYCERFGCSDEERLANFVCEHASNYDIARALNFVDDTGLIWKMYVKFLDCDSDKSITEKDFNLFLDNIWYKCPSNSEEDVDTRALEYILVDLEDVVCSIGNPKMAFHMLDTIEGTDRRAMYKVILESGDSDIKNEAKREVSLWDRIIARLEISFGCLR